MFIDLLSAFGLSHVEKPGEAISILRNTSCFRAVREAIESDRSPGTIMRLAEKVGMKIPIGRRAGLQAYRQFIETIRLYGQVDTDLVLDPAELIASESPKDHLKRFKDEEMERIVGPDYDSRTGLIDKVMEEYVIPMGRFHIESSFAHLNSLERLISFEAPGEQLFFSVERLITRIEKGKVPTPLLLQLKRLIVRRLDQWRLKERGVFSLLMVTIEIFLRPIEERKIL